MNISNLIPGDKARHFVAGAVASLVGFGAAAAIGWSIEHVAAAAVGLAAFVGIAKEVLDRADNAFAREIGRPPMHDVEFLDFAWTAAGGLPIFIGAMSAAVLS